MEFLKTLAREAELMSAEPSNTYLLQCAPALRINELSSPLRALHAAVVMEILADELEVLGATVCAVKPDLRTTASIKIDKHTNRPKFKFLPKIRKPRWSGGPAEQHRLRTSIEQRYSTVIPRRMLQGLGDIFLWPHDAAKSMMNEAKIRTDTPAGKYQLDLTFIQLIADNCVRELLQTGSYSSLDSSVNYEKTSLRRIWVTCIQLTKDRVTIASLKEQIQTVTSEMKTAVKELDAEIFNLMDKGLELDRRLTLETRLMEKQVTMLVKRFKRRHRNVLHYHHEHINQWRVKLGLESRVHWNIYSYLQTAIQERDDLLMYWTDKYETDFTKLCAALDEMITARDRDLKRARWLEMMIQRREPIVMDDRRLKELAIEEVKRREREIWCAIKVQSWWRGTMVRNKLGPYRPVIAKPTKKGAKGDKKNEKGKK